MKKSNALMLSYLIFLFISLSAKLLFDWNGLDVIALAASVSGLFFAVSDYINWKVICIEDSYYTLKEALSKTLSTSNRLKVFIEEKNSENEKILRLTGDKHDSSHPFTELLDCVERESNVYKEYIDFFSKQKNDFDELSKKAENKYLPKIKKLQLGEFFVLVFGFTCFFVILTFESIYTSLLNYSSIITVFSFGIILLTYFIKDTFEDKTNKELKQLLEDTKQDETKIERIILDATKNDTFEEMKKYIYIIMTGEHMERKNKTSGENNNG